MQRLLKLGTNEFLTGASITEHTTNSGIFAANDTNGVSAVLTSEGDNAGLLAAAPPIDDNAGAVVVDIPIAGTVDSTLGGNTALYMIGSGGHLYSVTSTAFSSVTDRRSGTQITDPANGIEIFQPQGGTKYLYYWQETQIGRWDLASNYPTGWTDNWATGLQDTTAHPTHKFFDRIYYGNKDRIGSLEDDGAGGVTHSTNVLDFNSDVTVNSITDDGNYLVVAVSTQQRSNINASGSKVVFWDTNSSSWQREWSIPQSTGIASVVYSGGLIYAIDTAALWVMSFNSPPQPVIWFDNTTPRLDEYLDSDDVGHCNDAKMIAWRDGVAWVNRDGGVSYYGKVYPNFPRSLQMPFAGFTSPKAIMPIFSNGFLNVTGDSVFYAVNTADSGQTGLSAGTVHFPFDDTVNIGKIVLRFGRQLQSGDELNVDIRVGNNSAEDWGTASFATHGAVKKVELYGEGSTTKSGIEALRLILNFTGGDVRIRDIEVWGEFTA